MQSHLVDPGKNELRWSRKSVGQFYTIPERKTYTLMMEPWEPLGLDGFAFDVLKTRLHSTGLDYKIYDDGRVKVVLPHGQKMGYILGWVAWVYDTLNEDTVPLGTSARAKGAGSW